MLIQSSCTVLVYQKRQNFPESFSPLAARDLQLLRWELDSDTQRLVVRVTAEFVSQPRMQSGT